MPIRVYKPTSPARRFMSVLTYEEVTKKKPERALLEVKKKNAGRNNQGRICVRHQGGGNKAKYRVIDFRRDKLDVPAKVAAIEYDPNRSAFIALLHYLDGEKRYILAPRDLKVGDMVVSGENADIKDGNSLQIQNIPVGTLIHNVEIRPCAGGQLVRSAWAAAQLMAKEGALATLRMPSGEMRKVSMLSRATIGTVGVNYSTSASARRGAPAPHGCRAHRPRRCDEPCGSPHGGGEQVAHQPSTPGASPRWREDPQAQVLNDMIVKRINAK